MPRDPLSPADVVITITARLQVPSKQFVNFEQSGHAPHHEEGEQSATFMARVLKEVRSR